MTRIHLWFGPNGTGKTRAALEGASADQPVGYFELEPGGYKRASGGMQVPNGAIELKKFRVPATELEQMGTIKTGEAGGLMPQLRYKLEGWVEVLTAFTAAYMEACKAGKRPVIDTATRLWLMQRQAYEQQVQDATGKEAEKLGQLKYTAPNARMISVAEYAERYDLDLILIAHEDTVFNSSPPEYKPDTMKELVNLADVVLRFRIKNKVPVATIWKGAEAGLDMKDKEIEWPTLERVNLVLDCAAAIRGNQMPMPESIEDILNTGKLLGVSS